jgi:hypothetical protein
MPTVTCPGCQKQYKLPDTAAGQVASCKCGKRFRVGGASPATAAASPATTATPRASPAQAPARSAAPAVSKAPAVKAAAATAAVASNDDDFWDKALSEPVKDRGATASA